MFTEGRFLAEKTSVGCVIKYIYNAPENTAEDSRVYAYLKNKNIISNKCTIVNASS